MTPDMPPHSYSQNTYSLSLLKFPPGMSADPNDDHAKLFISGEPQAMEDGILEAC